MLKQLVATIGMEPFRRAIGHYFQRHAYSNATLSQFLDAVQEGSGSDLRQWAHLWLETPSVNTIAAAWESDGQTITRFALTQTAPHEHMTRSRPGIAGK